MRRRSNTIHAKNFSTYLDASLRADAPILNHLHPKPKRILKRSLEEDKVTYEDIRSQNDMDSDSHEDNSPLNNLEKRSGGDDEWDNFDFDCEQQNPELKEGNMIFNSGATSLALSENTADTDYSDENEGNRNSILKRIMVIGLNNIGKRSLINSIFECGEPDEETGGSTTTKNQIMDLIMKTEQEEGKDFDTRYQFWIRSLWTKGSEKGRFENLFRTYYKNVSLFIFVYSINDQESLKCLDEVIEGMSQEIPPEKFTTALLGTKNDLEQERKVSFFDGIALQEKHNITFFIETNSQDKSLKEKLIKLMNENENESEEVNRDKRNSLLSIE